MSARVELSPEQLRELARLVAAELRAEPPSAGMVDAAVLAGQLGVARSWVYRHAVELGGVRLGGPHQPAALRPRPGTRGDPGSGRRPAGSGAASTATADRARRIGAEGPAEEARVTGDGDPLRFVEDALAMLPEDPADVSLAGLVMLGSVAEGLRRLVIDNGAEIAALDYRVRNGEKRADLAHPITVCELRVDRTALARERLAAYTASAARALGVTDFAGTRPASNRPEGGREP